MTRMRITGPAEQKSSDPKDRSLLLDALSWCNLTYGRDWSGEVEECSPIYDTDLSLNMAISLINYLAEQYGTEKVTAYCFDTCSFEEAFGVDYATARAAWEQSLMDRFGDSSENP